MGLGLEVGSLAGIIANEDEEGIADVREDFTRINEILAAAGLPPHVEPEKMAEKDVFMAEMFGYVGLHTLRRVASWAALGKGLPPPADRAKTAHDPATNEWYDRLRAGEVLPFEHVINHADNEGVYLPQDFPRVLAPEPEMRVAPIGSTVRLLEECKELARILGAPLDLDPEGEAMDRALKQVDKSGWFKPAIKSGWQVYPVETYSCLQLIRGCEASLRTGAALVFC